MNTRVLGLCLLLAATGPWAAAREDVAGPEQAVTEPTESPPTPAADPAGADPKTPPADVTAAAPSAAADSPFEYRASEQISEDLSVSFPVDI